MGAWQRTTKRDLIDSSRKLNAAGCATYTVYNIGNTIVTLDGIFPLLPGEQYEGANENPEVEDYSDIDILFADFPYAGLAGFSGTIANKDNRVVITRSYITKKG